MVLFLTYGRSRFSDAQRIGREPVRGQGFLRTVVTEFKTARVRDRRGMALPVCAQVTGISGMDWATVFMDVRATLK
eukprot:319262-Amphidinium_carterae.1